jgi:hypothetical protein
MTPLVNMTAPANVKPAELRNFLRLGFFGRRQQGTFTQLHILSSLLRRVLVRTEIDIRWAGAVVNGDMSNKFDTQFRNTPSGEMSSSD